MILLLGGTSDANALLPHVKAAGFKVAVATVTAYGSQLARASGADDILTGVLDGDALHDLLQHAGIRAVVDATHPFAVEISTTAMKVCALRNVPYIRFERPSLELSADSGVYVSEDMETGMNRAVEIAARVGGALFSTIGSRWLHLLLDRSRARGVRLVARVLPDRESIGRCIQAGLEPEDIVAIKGACNRELNKALFAHYGSAVVLTKESGSAGGTDAKLAAAGDLNLPVVVIARPRLTYPLAVETPGELVDHLQNLSARTPPPARRTKESMTGRVGGTGSRKSVGVNPAPKTSAGREAVDPEAGVLVLGHGSRRPEANRVVASICASIAEQTGGRFITRPCFLQQAHPTIIEAAAELVEAGLKRIVVMPFFLFPGTHVREDIPQVMRQLREVHPDVEFFLAENLGADARLADLVLERVGAALKTPSL